MADILMIAIAAGLIGFSFVVLVVYLLLMLVGYVIGRAIDAVDGTHEQ